MKDDYVSASELSRISYCERQVAFDAEFGRRTTAQQRQAAERGTHAHEQVLEESRRLAQSSGRKGRCFVATLALGDCAETSALRQYRDLILRRSAWGRRVIAIYNRLSPWLCGWLGGRPRVLSCIRVPMKLLACGAAAAVDRPCRWPPAPALAGRELLQELLLAIVDCLLAGRHARRDGRAGRRLGGATCTDQRSGDEKWEGGGAKRTHNQPLLP